MSDTKKIKTPPLKMSLAVEQKVQHFKRGLNSRLVAVSLLLSEVTRDANIRLASPSAA